MNTSDSMLFQKKIWWTIEDLAAISGLSLENLKNNRSTLPNRGKGDAVIRGRKVWKSSTVQQWLSDEDIDTPTEDQINADIANIANSVLGSVEYSDTISEEGKEIPLTEEEIEKQEQDLIDAENVTVDEIGGNE